MARKTGSYKFEKRRRELDKKKKKAEKRERKVGKNGDDSDDAEQPEPSPRDVFFAGLSTDVPDER